MSANRPHNKGKRAALLIGTYQFDDPGLAQLRTPGRDIVELAEVLNKPEIGGFDEVRLLENEPFAEIQLAISDFLADRDPMDLLVLYFSGHGVRDAQGRLYLAAKNTRRNRLSASGVASSFIDSEMQSCRSRRQILLLDCCFSGAFVRGTKGPLDPLGLDEHSFMGSATVVLTATTAVEYAWEGHDLIGGAENSLFTHFLIEGLRDGAADSNGDSYITVDELYEYASEQIADVSASQTPRKFVYAQEGHELIIARNPSVKMSSLLGMRLVDIRPIAEQLSGLSDIYIQCRSHAFGNDPTAANYVIAGETTAVLRALCRSHRAQIGCIYFDPPYGQASEQLARIVDLTSSQIEKNTLVSDQIQAQHIESRTPLSTELVMAILLARELLSEDGVLYIRCNDQNLHYLRIVLDEVFGSAGHVATLIIRHVSPKSRRTASRSVSVDHEYIACYARSLTFRFRGQPRDTSTYINPDNDPRGPWMAEKLVGSSGASERPELYYPVIHPETGHSYYPGSKRVWRYSKEKVAELITEGRILWPKTADGQVRHKRFLSEAPNKPTPISSVIDLPWTDTPKMESSFAIKRLLRRYASPALVRTLLDQVPSDDFIVLDAFGGSAVTAEAVLNLNDADGGNRRFILVESNRHLAEEITNRRVMSLMTGWKEREPKVAETLMCVVGDATAQET